jgi:ribose 5-phosphate isomerase B
MKVAIGSDHAAYRLKQAIKTLLAELGHQSDDMGAFTDAQPADDYHLIGAAVAAAVAEGRADRGILMCGTGLGMSIAANKVPGAWAALCNDLFTAQKSREHNDANVLVMGARVIGEELAVEIVRVWLSTPYAGGRHTRRNANLRVIEEKYARHNSDQRPLCRTESGCK